MTDVNFHVLGAARSRSGEDPLLPFLAQARGSDVTISARDVRRLDAYRLQILLVAEKQWLIDGHGFRVTDLSDTFADGLARLGLSPDHFDKEATQ